MDKRKIFNKISKDIKEIKIQGARNIARKALYAYSLIPTENSIKKLMKRKMNLKQLNIKYVKSRVMTLV